MLYLWQHIKAVTGTYSGSVPLTHFLRDYCRRHPVLGSRDRKVLAAVVYSWYRCSRGLVSTSLPAEDSNLFFANQIRACLSLCNADNPYLPQLFTGVDTADSKFAFDSDLLFPADVAMSEGIGDSEWRSSMLVQPQLFIRVRKHHSKIVALLAGHNIPFVQVTSTCLSLPNGAAIDKVLPADWYVVQDASSQHTGSFFRPVAGAQWYDCCAGAGGKSLLLLDSGVPVRLTASDRRASILANLKDRFRLYGHNIPACFIADVAVSQQLATVAPDAVFDNIICDAPCSGSGTWARTPEQMYFFDKAVLQSYSQLQQTIAINVSQRLAPGGRLFYITCSVFRCENEDVVAAVCAATGLSVEHMELINGIGIKADSMFIAILK
jgi:16S rRNA (cytosine967-C5)-methyltransferase